MSPLGTVMGGVPGAELGLLQRARCALAAEDSQSVFTCQLLGGLSTMAAVSAAAGEIKIYESGSRSVDCSCETCYGTTAVLALLLVFWGFLYPRELLLYCSSKCPCLNNVSQWEMGGSSESLLHMD